jgi:mannose-6-phosphate isomerase-like protein (cupin superfamily)
MSYTTDDLRSTLTAPKAAPAAASPEAIAAAEYFDFSLQPPHAVPSPGSAQWIVRGQNFVLAYTEPSAGDAVWEGSTLFEQVVLLVKPDSAVRVSAGGEDRQVTGEAVIIVPPGDSRIVAEGSGAVVQLLQSDEPGWADRASNAASYAQPHPRVAQLEPWPEPVGGYKLRVYPMVDVPKDPNRFGRIFRSRAFMVNFLEPGHGPRDATKMSPHHHDDFEQCSLTVEGTYVHHIQTPWGKDATAWRPEEHVRVGSPSVTIIPPPTIHTSQAIGRGVNHLIDIFSGPRQDFSAKEGWILNADEYPMPPASS